MKLKIVTFSNHPLDSSNKLVESCEKHNLDLHVIIEPNWLVNAQKIKLLSDFLVNQSKDLVVMVVDAFDVIINAREVEVLEKYNSLEHDIVFSAEANFYFRNKALRNSYHKNYPKSSTVYRYLNSGTLIGKSVSLIKLLEEIISENQIDINDIDSLIKVRSDQYLYAKHFVDHKTSKDRKEYTITLDYQHDLFEVTGGRMRTFQLPYISPLHAFNAYKIERFLMKLIKLNMLMNTLTDIKYNQVSKQFINKQTRTTPLVIHIPGSWKSFEEIHSRLIENKRDYRLIKIPTLIISLLSYAVSLLIPTKIKM
ncbi:MAG: hypothetical protein JXR03_09060 [Cyclobacteriaceae bacterium]